MAINALPVGYVLQHDYKIVKNLGQGGFGITYLAEDTNLGNYIVIKEFLPQSMAVRDQSRYTVMPYDKGDSLFPHLLQRFIEEAKLLAGLRHPNIVKVIRLLEANDTAYFIMEYEEGETLEDYLNHTSKLREEDILGIMMPILEGTKYVHSKGILHRDIAPDNIYLKTNGMPMLIDFGAARSAVAEEGQKLSAIAKDGYSPPEQYTVNSNQNEATDIYALGAVFYRMITGDKPINTAQRQILLLEKKPDPIVNLVEEYKGKYDKFLLQSVMKALNVSQGKRFQSVQEFQKAISNGKMINSNNSNNKILGGLVGFILILGIVLGFSILNDQEEEIKKSSNVEDSTPLTLLENKTMIKKVKQKQNITDACASGNYKECCNLGVMYVNGKKVKQDYSKAVEYFSKACEHNNSKGCYNLGIMYHSGKGVSKDYFKAASFYKKSCLNGDARGCSHLGFMYEKGEGVNQNDANAVKFYTKACDGGITEGCSNLGFMYENGRGVAKNDTKAVELYTKVCESGDVIGCYNLGVMYENGQGTKIDNSKAIELYDKSCVGGDFGGCCSLGTMYEEGKGTSKNTTKAIHLYKKACDNNYALGCLNLGFIYEDENKDKTQTKQFYKKACDLGHSTGCENHRRFN